MIRRPLARVLPAAIAAARALAPGVAAGAAEAALPVPPLPVPPLRLPAPVSRTLPNGLRVVVFPGSRQPLVQLQLMVPAGAAQEPDSLPGLASLTSEFLRQGTTTRSAVQLEGALARAGAAFTTWTGRDYALVQCAVQTASVERMFELVSDAVVNPLFGGDDFPADLKAYGRRLDVQRQTVADFADQRLAEAVFSPHPYAHAASSDIQAILGATLPDVQSFHRDHWRPDRAVLAVAGDIAPEQAFSLAADWFGGWSGHAVPDRARPAPRPLAGVRIVDVPGIARTEVRVGVLGPGMATPGFASWSLAAGALESASLPPGVRVTLVPAREASALMLSSPAPIGQAPAQARRMVDVLRAFASAPPSGPALEAVRRRVRQRYPLTLETLGGLLGQWQMDDVAGLPADEIARAGEHAAAADLAPSLPQLRAAPAIVVVGPADSLRAPLAALGAVDVAQPDRPHAAPPDTLPAPTAEELRRGRAAIAAAVAAHGGANALQAVHTLVLEGDEYVYRDGREIPAEFSHLRVDPDSFATANKVFKLESRQVMVGRRGWSMILTDSVVTAPLDSAGLMALRVIFHSDLVHELRAASAPGASPALRGTETIDGHPCDLVDFTGPFTRERIAIDSSTHRVVAIDGLLGAGPTWHERRLLTDFRPVNGLLLPFSEDRAVDGQRNSHVITRSASVNPHVDMHLFSPPLDLAR